MSDLPLPHLLVGDILRRDELDLLHGEQQGPHLAGVGHLVHRLGAARGALGDIIESIANIMKGALAAKFVWSCDFFSKLTHKLCLNLSESS